MGGGGGASSVGVLMDCGREPYCGWPGESAGGTRGSGWVCEGITGGRSCWRGEPGGDGIGDGVREEPPP